jgi:hypothetical protein
MLSIHELSRNDDPPANLVQAIERNENWPGEDGLKPKIMKLDLIDVADNGSDIEGANSEDAQIVDCTSGIHVSTSNAPLGTGITIFCFFFINL